MNASELFKTAKLTEAIDAQIQEVRNNPADQARRLFLFEMLAFSGDLERAKKQIEVLKFDEVELQTATLNYRKVLESERQRRLLFEEGLRPQFLTPPPEHVGWRLEAVDCFRAGKPDDAAALLAKANAALPSVKGKLNGKPFEGIRDCDDLFGTVLEVLAQANYFWVPLEQVELITFSKPRFPRDVLWMAARLELPDSKGEVFVPNIYPASQSHDDSLIKLGRATDWRGPEGGPIQGLGARLFLVGEEAVPMFDWRELVMGEE